MRGRQEEEGHPEKVELMRHMRGENPLRNKMEVRNVPGEPKEDMTLQNRLDDLNRRVERLEKIVSRLEQDVSMLKNPWL